MSIALDSSAITSPATTYLVQSQPLTAAAFAPFGEVLETSERTPISINQGMTERYHALARVDAGGEDGHALINIFQALPYSAAPLLREMERHPLGSQAFMPLEGQSFIVVVAPASDTVRAQDLRVFVTDGHQGVNYRRGVWHHSLITLGAPSRFLVVDRGGAGHNCDVVPIGTGDAVRIGLSEEHARLLLDGQHG
ncbi:ureidoglycolate lyase [Oryzisolibacter propanilivorax]|uniref:Ureidoglycolate lyase n=1 Tax=Oryzisolibacter propanilivorax TaxID=1527607 RepID=A0A1G9VZ71_9BURK|nr:ureidoglycolate lyase [Oryzisolibacter propanilivorax]SDM77540.1 ureidoglycolate lyase [Oryzisolibacter propanilivorax]